MAKVTESSRRGGAARNPPPAGPGPAQLPRHGNPSPPPAPHGRLTQAARAPGSSPLSPHDRRVRRFSLRPPPARPAPPPPGPATPCQGRASPHPLSSRRALGPGRIPARVRVTASSPRSSGHRAKRGSGSRPGKGGAVSCKTGRGCSCAGRGAPGTRAGLCRSQRGIPSFGLLHLQQGKRGRERRLASAASVLSDRHGCFARSLARAGRACNLLSASPRSVPPKRAVFTSNTVRLKLAQCCKATILKCKKKLGIPLRRSGLKIRRCHCS